MTTNELKRPTPIATLPEGIHIIERRKLWDAVDGQPAEIILCYLPFNKVTPWVTWQRNVPERGGDGLRYWGHYYGPESEDEARADYAKRGR